MKSKQIVGIVVAGVVFIVSGVAGVYTNKFADLYGDKQSSYFKELEKLTKEASIDLPTTENYIGRLDIVGEISESSSSAFANSSGEYDHELYMKYVDEMMKSDKNKGILLYVNTPGGAVYQTDELYLKLMEYKEKTKRPVYAYFADQACSGGYYISMAADKIYANRNTWTGSIGVMISMVNAKGLYEKLGIEEINITSGANKAMGSVGQKLSEEQRGILQSLVDESYGQFVDIVANGRKMDQEKVRELADGRIYSANQALEAHLIDQVGSYDDLLKNMKKECKLSKNIKIFELDRSTSSFWSGLFGRAEKLMPKSETQATSELVGKLEEKNWELMYYAE